MGPGDSTGQGEVKTFVDLRRRATPVRVRPTPSFTHTSTRPTRLFRGTSSPRPRSVDTHTSHISVVPSPVLGRLRNTSWVLPSPSDAPRRGTRVRPSSSPAFPIYRRSSPLYRLYDLFGIRYPVLHLKTTR